MAGFWNRSWILKTHINLKKNLLWWFSDKDAWPAQGWTFCSGAVDHHEKQQQEGEAGLVGFHRGRVFTTGPVTKEQQWSCCPALCIPEARNPLSHSLVGSWSTGMRNLAERLLQSQRQSFAMSRCVENQTSPTWFAPEEFPQQSPA